VLHFDLHSKRERANLGIYYVCHVVANDDDAARCPKHNLAPLWSFVSKDTVPLSNNDESHGRLVSSPMSLKDNPGLLLYAGTL
jgi:hypothetical protein